MGSPYFNPHVTRPYDNPLPGQKVPEEHPLEGVMKMINGTSLFQKKFPGIYFVGSAYSYLRQFAPNVGAAVIKNGGCFIYRFGKEFICIPFTSHRSYKKRESRSCKSLYNLFGMHKINTGISDPEDV